MRLTSNIAEWLEELGLERYADLFAKHEIDLSILPDLSNDDLVEIGLPLGPRRRIHKAAAMLTQQAPSQEPRHTPVDSPERRHLTVMFADIVGSSVMSMKMDPEELRDLMLAFQDASKAAVDRFGGIIARFMGDGVLAYFGYPQAHEDDPERSVRAGFELIRLTAILNEKLCAGLDVTLQVRVGVATGPVVVGDLIGEGSSSERSVVGETPNIAAKIEASSPPGNVTVGQETCELLGNRFETEELPQKWLEGSSVPIRMHRIVSERIDMSRFEAKRKGSQTIFVGRREELAILQRSWASVCESRGNAVLITAEAGVGKSRFLDEFLGQAGVSKPTIIRFQCMPFQSNTAFHPVIERLESLAQLKEGDTSEMRCERLAGLVRKAPRAKGETLQLLAALMSVDIGGALPARLRDNPHLLKLVMNDMLVEQIVARTDDGPVIVVFEDAHWMDPTTLEWTVQLSQACHNQQLMVLVTSRPAVRIEHLLRKVMKLIDLSGLSKSETEKLIRSMPQARSLAPSALNAVVERTDGVPLFIEELTKLVQERGQEGANADSSIPSTLIDSLVERLDRLGSSKGVAQIGGTIGREFSFDLLSRIDERDNATLHKDITRLIDAELIHPIGPKEEPAYRFKHALVQDAAYGTLLYATRRQFHARIADAMLDVSPETANDKPEILAYHLNEGGRPLEAVDYWQVAGLNATRRSANVEAVHHISKGIEALSSLPTQPISNLKKELELQVALGPPLVAARGYASKELEAAFTRALEIGEQLDEGITDFRALWGLSSFYLLRGQLEQSITLQRECIAIAQQEENEDWLILASSWLGTVLFYCNELEEAADWLHRVTEHYRTESVAELGYQFGLHPAVLARVHLVWLHWLRGETDLAHVLDEETLTFAEDLDHPLSHVHALNFSVVLQAFQGNYQKALERADRVLSVSGEFEFPHYLAYARVMRGFALARLGAVDKGIDEMVKGLSARRETGAELVRPMLLTMLAEVLADSGQLKWSIEILDEAESIVTDNGEDWLQAETLRVRGTVIEQQNPGCAEAITCVRKALELAQQSRAVSLEIRALVSMIELKKSRKAQGTEDRELLQRLADLLAKLPEDTPSIDRQRSMELLAASGYG